MRTLLSLLTILLIFVCSINSDTTEDNDNLKRRLAKTPPTGVPTSVPTSAPLSAVPLGTAGNFAILTKTGITSVYKSTVTGNIGSSPITGAAMVIACDEVVGVIYSVNAAGPPCKITSASMLSTAVNDMTTAYNNAAGRINPNFLNLAAGSIGGRTLTPGLYKWTTPVNIASNIAIVGNGGLNDVWIFQIAGTLTMSSSVQIILSGGAQAKNIYWQVSGAVTLNSMSHFEGNILGMAGIDLKTSGTLNGRLLTQTAATLQVNTITKP